MSEIFFGKYQETAKTVCEKGSFSLEELDFLLRTFSFDNRWGPRIEQRLIRLSNLSNVDLLEIMCDWTAWLDELTSLLHQQERDRESQAKTRIKGIPRDAIGERMRIFMWHAFDYSDSDFEEFAQLVKTARDVRGPTGNKQIPLRLMDYDGSIEGMRRILEVFDVYKRQMESRMKLKYDARLSPTGSRPAIEALDAIRLRHSDDIN